MVVAGAHYRCEAEHMPRQPVAVRIRLHQREEEWRLSGTRDELDFDVPPRSAPTVEQDGSNEQIPEAEYEDLGNDPI